VYRIGEYPLIRIKYDECVYVTDTFDVLNVSSSDSGSTYDIFEIPDLSNHSDITNYIVVDSTGSVIGNVTSLNTTKLTDEVLVTDEAGVTSSYTPATYTAHLEVSGSITTDLTGESIGIVKKNPVGTDSYRRSIGGMSWILELNGSKSESMSRISTMLGTVYFSALKSGIAELIENVGDVSLSEITDSNILTAVTQLAQKETNIDGILAKQGENLELDRRSGNATYVLIDGIAP
jgi:hypothetical protein